MIKFSCGRCQFACVNKKDWFRHLNTERHLINCNDELVELPKQHNCELCHYSTHDISNYKKHLISKKHITNRGKQEDKFLLDQQIVSIIDERIAQREPTTIINNINNITNNNINNITNSNTMNNNQKFNLNVFLNDDCKDAFNLTDFINNISLTLADLEETARLGYTDGITKIINDRIKTIGQKKRPYHCTDKKRQIVYVKDDDLWEKEQDDKPKMKKMISKIIHKNIEQLSDWKKANPECMDISNRKGEEYLSIMVEANGGHHREEKEVQILKNIIDIVEV